MKQLALITLMLPLASGLMAGAEGSFEKSLTVSGPVDLDVKTDSGGITIKQGSAGKVRVHAILKAEGGWFASGDAERRIRELVRNPPVEQDGNRVRVGYVHERRMLNGISMRFEIETPADTDLHARADSGGIEVEGLRRAVDCKTDSGGIRISDVAGTVRAAADSGGIHVRDIKGSLFAHVDSGGIEASGIAGSIDAEAQSGSVRLVQTTPAPINAKAESGSVRVTLARGGGYSISADTESGHVSAPEMTVRSSLSSHHVEGKVGGGGPLVKIQVESGSVTVD
jgi:Putative adhesin